MAFSLEDFARTRPYLYHLTGRSNLSGIAASRHLYSAAALLRSAGMVDGIGRRRLTMQPIRVRGGVVLLRDQAPLIGANVAFPPRWALHRLVEELNGRVFFWPGWAHGPIRHGLNHFERCQQSGQELAIIRAPFASMRKHARQFRPEFCKYNSGSPRCVNGDRSPRGPDTFAPERAFAHAPGDVVEVTFHDAVALPPDAQVSERSGGPWQPLFPKATEL